jgi:sterol desaturase/sphingolipid hydroxylase (fatty acid hydroxylase superfamily)
MESGEFLQAIQQTRTLAVVLTVTLVVAWETLFPFMILFKGGIKLRIFHALKNWCLAFCNLLMQRYLFIGIWLTTEMWTNEKGWGLLTQLTDSMWIHGIVAFLVLDVWTYWWHRLNHRIPFLWRFHQVHHSDSQLDVTTAYRFHFGEIFISSLLRIPFILLLGVQLWEIVLFDALVFVNIQFHHANIGLGRKGDRLFSLLLTSPAMHKVHHSIDPSEHNSNFTFFLSIWDRLFATFKRHPDPEGIQFGLRDKQNSGSQKLFTLLASPFKK